MLLQHIALVKRRIVKFEALVAKQHAFLETFTPGSRQLQIGNVLLTQMTESLAVLKAHYAIISTSYSLTRRALHRPAILLRLDHGELISVLINGEIRASIDKVDEEWWLHRTPMRTPSTHARLNVTPWIFNLPVVESIIDLHLRGHFPWKPPPIPLDTTAGVSRILTKV